MPGQGTCMQLETLVHINSPTVTKKGLAAIQIFNGLNKLFGHNLK